MLFDYFCNELASNWSNRSQKICQSIFEASSNYRWFNYSPNKQIRLLRYLLNESLNSLHCFDRCPLVLMEFFAQKENREILLLHWSTSFAQIVISVLHYSSKTQWRHFGQIYASFFCLGLICFPTSHFSIALKPMNSYLNKASLIKHKFRERIFRGNRIEFRGNRIKSFLWASFL